MSSKALIKFTGLLGVDVGVLVGGGVDVGVLVGGGVDVGAGVGVGSATRARVKESLAEPPFWSVAVIFRVNSCSAAGPPSRVRTLPLQVPVTL